MATKITFEKASYNLLKRQPHLKLLEFADIHSEAKFLDNEFGEFIGKYRNVLYGYKSHKMRSAISNKNKGSKKLKLSFDEASKQINSKYSYLTLLNYNGISELAKFLDSEYGEFEAIFKYVRNGETNHKERSGKNKSIAAKNPSRIEKNKEMNLKKYGNESYFQTDEFKEKLKKTNLNKYGLVFHNKLTFKGAKDKLAANGISYELLEFNGPTKLAKFLDSEYGEFDGIFDNVCYGYKKHPDRSNFNIIQSAKNVDRNNKIKKTVIERYGVDNVFKSEKVKENIRKTNLEKYGVESTLQSKEIREKITKTKIKNGTIRKFDGKLLKDYIKDNNINISLSHANYITRTNGIDSIKSYENSRSYLEIVIANFLNDNNIQFKQNELLKLNDKTYYTDITVEDHKLIIECDGLLWHSDLKLTNKKYHKDKQNFYQSLGYRSLFFRQDEINNKLPIVTSIILAKLGLITNKVFARKTKLIEVKSKDARKFFEDNHLMGAGTGKCYALSYNNEIVSAIRIINKKKYIDVSRFCNKLNTNVVGGLSKLLKHVERNTDKKNIISFVDLRYGDGHSLLKLGFKEKSNHLSFKWTDFKSTYHRMTCGGNSGYEKGLFKIWDCGQKKFELLV